LAQGPNRQAIGLEMLNNVHIGAVKLHAREGLFLDDALHSLQSRALMYLRAGAPIHFRGPAGTGKTTLAMSLASEMGRPIVLVVGDSWNTSATLLGEQNGVKTKQVVDRYVSSIRKVESETQAVWMDNALTTAIVNGYTLIYDEFTRSPPQANNPLLMALEERILVIPGRGRSDRYQVAHPDFRVIFTSNPEEYAGITEPQDALIDRLITFDFGYQNRDVEIGIVQARTGAPEPAAAAAVDIVRALRASSNVAQPPSIRSAIIIARVAHNENFEIGEQDSRFVQLCRDVLEAKAPSQSIDPDRRTAFQRELSEAIHAISPNVAGEDEIP
jgi:gas vesicle protein GvpN